MATALDDVTPSSTSSSAAGIGSAAVPKGSFQRKESVFRRQIFCSTIAREEGAACTRASLPPAKGRYLLYVSFACPWACRCLAAMCVKGLFNVIEVAVVSPVWNKTKPDVEGDQHRGWVFDPAYPGCTVEPVFGAPTIRHVYDAASLDLPAEAKTERFTVPLLFDKQTKTIVNNESAEIMRMLNNEFNEFAEHPEVDLYPPALQGAIDAMNSSIYESINNGVYKCGFAQSQEAYEFALRPLFQRLEELEEHLSKHRFLVAPPERDESTGSACNTETGSSDRPSSSAGVMMTEADIRLFVTLVRFDAVYYVHFKCSMKHIWEFPNLSAWMRDVYQTGNLGASVNMQHIVDHYYRSHPSLNPYGIVPQVKPLDLSAPHDRR